MWFFNLHQRRRPGDKPQPYDRAGSAPAPKALDIQRALNASGAGLVEDGVWGPECERAVRDFQRQNGLTVDGVAGPEVFCALGLTGGRNRTAGQASQR